MTLLAAVDARDAEIATAEAALAEIVAKSAALSRRESSHVQARPQSDSDHDAAIVAALTDDPDVEHDAAHLVASAAQTRDALAVWKTSLGLIRRAKVQVDVDAAAARDRIRELEVAREEHWVAFVVGANRYAVGEFVLAFDRACMDTGDLAFELANLKTSNNKEIIGQHSDPRIIADPRNPFKVGFQVIVDEQGETVWIADDEKSSVVPNFESDQPGFGGPRRRLFPMSDGRKYRPTSSTRKVGRWREETLFPRKVTADDAGRTPLARFQAALRAEAAGGGKVND